MSFVSDSLLTTICLQYSAEQVAAAVVYLSYLFLCLPRVEPSLLETDDSVVSSEEPVKAGCLQCDHAGNRATTVVCLSCYALHGRCCVSC